MAPRAEIKQDKKDKVQALANQLSEAKSVVFVNYDGMDVARVSEFRDKLAEAGGKMLVAKNTLIKLAGKNANLPEEALTEEILSGQTAVIIADEDAVSPIQTLGKYSSENEMPKIKAGVVENHFQDEKGIIMISKMPGREQLQAQVVGAVGAPLYGLVGTLQGNLTKLVFILDQKRQQMSA